MNSAGEIRFIGLSGSKILSSLVEEEAERVLVAHLSIVRQVLTIRSYRQHHGRAPLNVTVNVETEVANIEVSLHAPRTATIDELHIAAKRAFECSVERLSLIRTEKEVRGREIAAEIAPQTSREEAPFQVKKRSFRRAIQVQPFRFLRGSSLKN